MDDNNVNDTSQSGDGAGKDNTVVIDSGESSKGKEKNMEGRLNKVKKVIFETNGPKIVFVTVLVMLVAVFVVGYFANRSGLISFNGNQEQEVVMTGFSGNLPTPAARKPVVSTTKAPSAINNDRPKSAPAKVVAESAPVAVPEPAKVSEPTSIAAPAVSEKAVESVSVQAPAVSPAASTADGIKNTMDTNLYVALYGDWDGAKLVMLAPGETLKAGLDLGNGKKLISGVHMNFFTLYNNGVNHTLDEIFTWDAKAETYRPNKTWLATYYWAGGLIPINGNTNYGKAFTILAPDGLFYDGHKVTEKMGGHEVAIAVDVKDVGRFQTRLMRY